MKYQENIQRLRPNFPDHDNIKKIKTSGHPASSPLHIDVKRVATWEYGGCVSPNYYWQCKEYIL